MEFDEKPVSCSDPLLLCCKCKSMLQEPVQLQCLHSCCRRCFNSEPDAEKSNNVTCPSCNQVTKACDAEPNTFLDYLVRGCLAVAEMKVCTICKENGDDHALALEWCGSCRLSFCGDCAPAHKRLNRNHCTQPIDELMSLEDVRTKVPSPSCSLHDRPLEFACFTCQKAKCLNCWAACNQGKHEMGLMTEESFEVRLKRLKSEISSMEKELLTKSDVIKKCKNLPSELKSSRDEHLEKMQQRKRLVMDAIERVYQEIEHSTKNMYEGVEMEAENVAAIATRLEQSLSFSRDYVYRLIDSNRHCDLWNQQKVLRSHLVFLSAELDELLFSMSESESVRVQPSLPENLEYVLRSWIGEPQVCTPMSSYQQRPQLFYALSGCIQLPRQFHDVALTQDGHVLLAADEQGLLEFCSSGNEVSQWKTAIKTLPDKTDEVRAVCALRDGQVAVGLFNSKTVVILQKTTSGSIGNTVGSSGFSFGLKENNFGSIGNTVGSIGITVGSSGFSFGLKENNFGSIGNTVGSIGNTVGSSGFSFGVKANNFGSIGNTFGSIGNTVGSSGFSFGVKGNNFGSIGNTFGSVGRTWIECRRIDELQSPAQCLAVHGDMLAVAEWSLDEQKAKWNWGPQLELMKLSNGKQHAAFIREYVIGSIALTDRTIITSSHGKLLLSSSSLLEPLAPSHSREVYVIDGYNDKNVLLWRYELPNGDEVIRGIFPNPAGRILYVALPKSDESGGRVAAISLDDRSEQRHHVLNFDGRRLPVRLSLDGSGAVIAALCIEAETKEQRTVTLHMIA